jgi:RNA polymerase sigma-70 factor (ECF subfamily)
MESARLAVPPVDVSLPPVSRPGGSLAELIRAGDIHAAELLYRQYAGRLVSLVRTRLPTELATRIEAEDVVQSVFRRFIARYARGGYDVPDGPELWNLLFVMALNKIRDESSYHRAARRNVHRVANIDPALIARGPDDQEQIHLQLAIDELISPLSADRRAAIELRLAGHDVAGIATTVGRSKRTIERYLQEFRSRLEAALMDPPT